MARALRRVRHLAQYLAAALLTLVMLAMLFAIGIAFALCIVDRCWALDIAELNGYFPGI